MPMTRAGKALAGGLTASIIVLAIVFVESRIEGRSPSGSLIGALAFVALIVVPAAVWVWYSRKK